MYEGNEPVKVYKFNTKLTIKQTSTLRRSRQPINVWLIGENRKFQPTISRKLSQIAKNFIKYYFRLILNHFTKIRKSQHRENRKLPEIWNSHCLRIRNMKL